MGEPIEMAEEAERLIERLKLGDRPSLVELERREREWAERDASLRLESRLQFELNAINRALPPKLARVAASPQETLAVQAALAWQATEARGLMIRGGIGVGKSAAAAAIVARFIRNGRRSVSWMKPNDLVSAVLHSYDDKAPKLGTDLIVVDDLGRETKADFVEALCAFLDDHDTRFILTTNLQKDEFRTHYDPRLVDRLNECAKAVSIKGDSMRRKDGGF